jgi:hypothetical protein
LKLRPTAFFAPALMVVVGGLATGCTLFKAVTMPVQLAATGVVAVGETAGAVVSTSGRLAAGTVRAVGSVGSVGLEAAARLAEEGMVTFVGVKSGEVSRVVWRPGSTLAESALSARVQIGLKGVELLRAGQRVLTANSREAPAVPVASGDVVRVLD